MFQLPTLKEIAERTRQAFRVNLKGSDAWVWPNNVYVSAKVMSGGLYENFGFQAYVAKQMFAHTAPDIESVRLHGEEFNIPQKPAAPAKGKATFTGDAGFTMDTGALLTRADGVQYSVVSGNSRNDAGTLTLDITSVDNGRAGNAEEGTALVIASGLTTTGNVTAEVGPDNVALGVDIEDIESYRQRILFRKRNPPHGGAPADYVMWVGQVAGVSFFEDRPTVFVERRWNGPGTVRVFPLMFDLYDDGIPDSTDIDRVAAYLSLVEPAGAEVTVQAPAPVPVPVVINGLKPYTEDVKIAAELELRDAFKRLARVAGDDVEFPQMPYLAYPTTFSVSWIWQAIANATGEVRHIVSSPSADIVLTSGQYPVFGGVTFNP